MSKKFIFLFGFGTFLFFVFLVSFLIIQKGKNAKETSVIVHPTPTNSQVSWVPYANKAYGISLQYLSSYSIREVLLSRYKYNKPLVANEFLPSDVQKWETDTITLEVFDRDGTETLDEWIAQNATEKTGAEMKESIPPKALFNVISQSNTEISGKPAKLIVQKAPNDGVTMGRLLLQNGKFVYSLSHASGHVEDVYEKMISTLSFE